MFQRNCREVTLMVLTGQDRRLNAWERFLVRTHMKVCGACPRFLKQMDFMRSAMGRWRNYSERE